MARWRSSSNWVVATDTGERCSCSAKEDIGLMGVAGRVEDSMMGSVVVREDGDEIEVADMVEVIDWIEEAGTKLG